MKITLLGTGTSTGVPVIGCSCRVCQSEDARDKRLRCACFVKVHGVNILIDAGPDFRLQALRAGITQIDAVLLTHHHFDHVVGLDDLRPFFIGNHKPIPCFAHPDTAQVLRTMFCYIFEDGSYPGVAKLELHEIQDSFSIESRYDAEQTISVTPIELLHGRMPVLGFRIGNFAYLTDTNKIPEREFAALQNLDVLVLDALRHKPHPSHFTITEAIAMAEKISAKDTYFTHMTHSVLHEEENANLPEGMGLAYDGLSVNIPYSIPDRIMLKK